MRELIEHRGQNIVKKTSRLISETVAAMLAVIFFYLLQGVLVVTQRLEGVAAKWTQSIFIWASVIVALIFFLIKKKSLACLGFLNPNTLLSNVYFILFRCYS